MPAMLASLVTSNKADVLATAYAPAAPDYSRQSALRFDPDRTRTKAVSCRRSARRTTPGPQARPAARCLFCRRTAMPGFRHLFRSARRIRKGQAAVAQVILNRVRNPAYPKTICGVVYQNEDWRNRCQFSFACDNIKDRVNSQDHWRDRPRRGDGGDRRQDLAAGSRFGHALSCRLRPSEMGAEPWKRSAASACMSSTAPMAVAGAEAETAADCGDFLPSGAVQDGFLR